MDRFSHSCVGFAMGAHPYLPASQPFTMNRFNHSCVGFAMGVHPCTMGRFMMSHSYRMDATMDKLSYCHCNSHGKHPKPGPQWSQRGVYNCC